MSGLPEVAHMRLPGRKMLSGAPANAGAIGLAATLAAVLGLVVFGVVSLSEGLARKYLEA